MKCPNCRFQNPEAAKFCVECGNKLEIICPECGSGNSPSFKFCSECGQKFIDSSEPLSKEFSFDEKLDKIQRYLPKGIIEKILSQRGKIEGEKRHVTVMFCDIEGFTALVEQIGAEDVYNIMDQIYELLIHKVHQYEGTVNEMTGDGVMALFGAPIALEDAPQRAIRSAIAIHRELTKFNEKQKGVNLPSLRMRIGIHTGPVIVGTLGNNLRVEFKAVGDTVNLASRMENLSQPGTTYVSGETFKLTEGLFRFESLGEKMIKGKEEPVMVYRVIASSTRRTRFDVSAERGLTPFVGRERELELLIDGFERARAGRGQAFSIISEAGVGKSRLLFEFIKVVTHENITYLEGKCLSYSKGVAYHPITDILKTNFNVQEGDTDSSIREKVKSGLKIIGADETSTTPYLLELLSVKDSGIDNIMMSPEGKKNRVIEALKRIVLKGSDIRPVVMIFEDLHWVDKSSEEVLKYILECIPGARVLLIFSYRPEFVHTWGAKSYHNQITLNRLSNRESLAMVSHILESKEIDRNLEELILEKAEGVPFFIEEFLKSLKELKIIDRDHNKYGLAKGIETVVIPSTIQDVIMARVDSLPESAKRVLQIGSVIEREFRYDLIQQVTGLPETELLFQLSVLKDLELLYERGIYPKSTYIFKHALTQEVVYDSILTKRKRQYHENIARAIEKIFKENIDEKYELLSEHYIRGGEFEKGAEYSKLVRKKALKTGSVIDGIAYAIKTVECLEHMPQTDNILREIAQARTSLGFHYAQINYHVEAKEAIDPIIDMVLNSRDKRMKSQVLTIVGTYQYMVEEDYPKAIDHLEDALKLAEEAKDEASLILAGFWLGLCLALYCRFDESLIYYKGTRDRSLAVNSLWSASVVDSNKSSFVYFPQGKMNDAFRNSFEAIRLAEESNDIYSKTIAYSNHAISYYGKGYLKKAEHIFLKGITFAEKLNYLIWLGIDNYFLGEIHSEFCEYENAMDCYHKAIVFLKQSKVFRSWMYLSKIALAKTKVLVKDENVKLDPLYNYVSKNRLKAMDGLMYRYMGEILLNIDSQRTADVEDLIKKAIEFDKKNSFLFSLGADYAFYAKFLKRKGDISKADEYFAKAIDILIKCGADGWVEKYNIEFPKLPSG